MSDIKVCRSLLFVPANSWKMLNKACGEMEDGIIMDLEDACPLAEKETGRIFARDIVPSLKENGIYSIVRVNDLTTKMTADDLKIVICEGLDGIMLPKSESKEDIIALAEMISREEAEKDIKQRISILPLLESPKGVLNAREIGSASDRVKALCFGAGDYMRELGEGFTISRMEPREYFPVLLYARSVISNVASTLGIPAIDTPFFGVLTDTEGLVEESKNVKLLGFKGKLLTHPRHVEYVNEIFSPSEEDITFSRTMVEAYKEIDAKGKGAAVVNGKMIDYAMYKMGMDMLSVAEQIEQREKIRLKQ
jgi:citrate lyase subunit beta / citryl-CoA lyase